MKQRYNNIQALRGLSALLVVMMHIQMIGNGAFGAELFFCISGFITMHVTEEDSKDFLKKRAIRIIPLYWLVAFATSALLIIAPTVFRSTSFHISYLIKTLLFIPYHSGSFVSLVSVGWTLILEVLFYLIFFVSSLVSRRYRHYITSAIILLMVLAGYSFRNLNNFYLNFYCKPVILEFVLGMFSYGFLAKRKPNYSHKAKVFCFLGAVLILIALLYTKYVPALEGVDRFFKWGIPAYAVFVLMFIALSNCKLPKPVIKLGDISYSMYLTHSFVVQGFSRLIYNIDTFSPLGAILTVCVVIPLVIAVSYISWWLVEQKLTNLLKKVLLKKHPFITNAR